ncbi:hypothetical protein BDK92_0207 [Micromonospora pisi]|uniref:Uncharacterized protein n=1 Tax=Micromonospora pisi TaxID=589240 RepID=A0A495JD48_9ACTN|nr:hypothetical protein [Micromonospora pisi]RKR85989.1 hypothetical protein BDK92_0207 [Micromonospora pisi]
MGSGIGRLARHEIDDEISKVSQGCEAIAAALYTIDAHETNGYVRTTDLGGATGELWQATRPRIGPLWEGFANVRDHLEQIRGVRGTRNRLPDATLMELSRLLHSPVPGFDVRPYAAVTALTASCQEVIRVLDRIATARAEVAAWAAELAVGLTDLATAEADLTDGSDTVSARLGATCQQLQHTALADPVGAVLDPGERVRLRSTVTATVERFTALAGIRDTVPDRLAALDRTLAAVTAAQDLARVAYARVTEKIADPGLVEPLDPVPGLWAAATALVRRAPPEPEGWSTVADRLTVLEGEASAALAAAADRTRVADGLIGRRDELRGRLEAYRAKAVRLGRAEEPRLTGLHSTARDLLWTAPCDLRAATRAVYAYQQALTGNVERSAG